MAATSFIQFDLVLGECDVPFFTVMEKMPFEPVDAVLADYHIMCMEFNINMKYQCGVEI